VSPDHVSDQLGIARFAGLAAVPWRNGGGVMREVVAWRSGSWGFDWRISIADVNAAGPFSAFPGVDRIIILVEGKRMDLVIDGVEHVLGARTSQLRRREPGLLQSPGRPDARPQRHDAWRSAVGRGRHQGPLGNPADRRRPQPGPGAVDRIGLGRWR
jgi:hypothetical protein